MRTASAGCSSLFVTALRSLGSMPVQEALCRPVIRTQPAGSNCGHFLLTNIHTHTNREKEALAELQLGLPPSRVTKGTGEYRPMAHCSTKAPNLATFNRDYTHFCSYTHLCWLFTHAPPAVRNHICRWDPFCVMSIHMFSETETRLQTPFKTMGV